MTLFIITSSAGMQSVYGADGYQLILAKSRELASSIPGAEFNILDDALSMGQHPAAKDNTAAALNAALSQLTNIAPAANNMQPSILILGDHRIFPYFEVPNPVQNRLDPDSNVLTDNPYGSAGSQNWLQPQLAVGRIAAGVSDSAEDFCKLLDIQISLRKARPIRAGYVEFTSRQWQNTSAFVMSVMASPSRVFVSPDDRIAAPNASNLDCKFLYCNLHGFQNQSAWLGFDPGTGSYVPALTPDAFSAQYLQGSIVFSEACYGLQTQGRNTSSSCALSLLAAGAAVVGSAGLAFGSSTPQTQTLIDADALARGFFDEALKPNATLGSCLQAARSSLRQSAPSLDMYLKKTLLEFQLLGDPSYEI